MKEKKLTKAEKSWILYDVANSECILILTATIPIYFRELATQEDFSDVELSAASLAEIMSVVQELPYPPNVFIDECLDAAVTALENQKRVYTNIEDTVTGC